VDLCAILSQSDTPLLTTAFYLVADAQSGTVRYANAGHPKPLHVRRNAGRVVPLANAAGKSQPALGLFEDATYQTSLVKLSPNDLIMLFTDGLIEVQGRNNELYSTALLIAGVQRRLRMPASGLFDELLAEVQAFSADGVFSDELCLVGMEFTGAETGAN
jgi:phosphoserine phosphatase RsbU/P